MLFALGGYAAVWALGLRLIVWPVVAVALLWWMATRAVRWRVPTGFGLWWGFLAWSAISVLVVDSPERLAAWAYRESLYLSATVALVFLVSVPSRWLPTRRIAVAVTWLFGSTVLLGLVGVLVPDLAVPTVVESLLPHSMTSSQFVQEQVMGRVSATAEFLGAVRPVAPYGYTNEWGAALGMLIPLAIHCAWYLVSTTARVMVGGLVVLAVVLAVISVNRGLWISVAVACVVVLARSLVGLRPRLVALTVALVVGATALVWFTPLREIVVARLNRPNLGTRMTLAGDALSLAGQSPWFGYGAPQESAVGIGTNDASVGTHGQLFTLLVSHGIPGAVFYLGFIVAVLVATWRVAPRAWWAWSALVVLFVQTTFYNGIPVPLVLGFLAMALCLREVRQLPGEDRARRGPRQGVVVSDMSDYPSDPPRTVRAVDYPAALRSRTWLLLLCLGLGAATAVLGMPDPSWRSTAAVEVRTGYADLASTSVPGSTNMVTEQQVARSSAVLAGVSRKVGGDVSIADLGERGVVSNPPDSTTLAFSFTSPDPELARRVAAAWSSVYLAQRGEALDATLQAALSEARARMASLRGAVTDARQEAAAGTSGTRSGEAAALRVENLGSQLEAAQQAFVQLRTLDVDPGRSLGNASAAQKTGGVGPELAGVLGALGGLVLGAALAVLLARADRRVSGLPMVAGVEVWGEVPHADPAPADLEAVVARLALRHRRDDLRQAMVAPLIGSEADVVPSLVDAVDRLGVAVTMLDEPLRLLDADRQVAASPGPRGDSRRRVVRGDQRLTMVRADPLLVEPTTVVLAGQVDLVVLTVDATRADRRDVEDAVARLARNGAVVDGLLVMGGRISMWRLALRRRRRVARPRVVRFAWPTRGGDVDVESGTA